MTAEIGEFFSGEKESQNLALFLLIRAKVVKAGRKSDVRRLEVTQGVLYLPLECV